MIRNWRTINQSKGQPTAAGQDILNEYMKDKSIKWPSFLSLCEKLTIWNRPGYRMELKSEYDSYLGAIAIAKNQHAPGLMRSAPPLLAPTSLWKEVCIVAGLSESGER